MVTGEFTKLVRALLQLACRFVMFVGDEKRCHEQEALIADRHSRVPMGHMGDGWDVAHAVLFLASDEARFITGTEIIVDGGMIATIP